jgi:hypothetical protein
MDPSVSICTSFSAYQKIREQTPDPAFKGVQGSLRKSLECGCGHCSLSCNLVGKGDEVQRNKERNQHATVKNSRLRFDDGSDAKGNGDVVLTGEFNGSGLSFEGTSDETEEVFVLDSKD